MGGAREDEKGEGEDKGKGEGRGDCPGGKEKGPAYTGPERGRGRAREKGPAQAREEGAPSQRTRDGRQATGDRPRRDEQRIPQGEGKPSPAQGWT